MVRILRVEDFDTKPIDIAHLLEKIERLLVR